LKKEVLSPCVLQLPGILQNAQKTPALLTPAVRLERDTAGWERVSGSALAALDTGQNKVTSRSRSSSTLSHTPLLHGSGVTARDTQHNAEHQQYLITHTGKKAAKAQVRFSNVDI